MTDIVCPIVNSLRVLTFCQTQSWVAKRLANNWRHSWYTDVGIRMTSLQVLRQTFGYSILKNDGLMAFLSKRLSLYSLEWWTSWENKHITRITWPYFSKRDLSIQRDFTMGQTWVAKRLSNIWSHSQCMKDFINEIRMTSLPVFRQTFGYPSLLWEDKFKN